MFDLTSFNTLGVRSGARELHRIRTLADLQALAGSARDRGFVVLGGGSNVVLGEHLDQPVFLMTNRGVRTEHRHGRVEVTAAAGENWHDLVRWTLGQGLSGIENLALIPGSVGAAPVQNIGAYGVELDERFVALTALEVATGELRRLVRSECAFGYRTSLFKSAPGRFVIAEVTLALDAEPVRIVADYPDVALELERMGRSARRPVDIAEAVIRVRRRKLPDPRRVPNAGSFFKNPVVSDTEVNRLRQLLPDLKTYGAVDGSKLAAAQLIEACSISPDGQRAPWASPEAPVRVWSRQSLVLTNPGRRPAAEVLAVAAQIQSEVASRYGVRLELEPDTFGC